MSARIRLLDRRYNIPPETLLKQIVEVLQGGSGDEQSSQKVFRAAEAAGGLSVRKGMGQCVARACRTFGVPRASYYKWKKAYEVEGEAGLVRKRPIARKHPRAIPQETIDKVLELRIKYHPGPQRIVWYMERYHSIRIASSSVYRILVRHGVSRFPSRIGCRALHTCRYAEEVPGHHIQLDVKVLSLKGTNGAPDMPPFGQYIDVPDLTALVEGAHNCVSVWSLSGRSDRVQRPHRYLTNCNTGAE